MIRTQISFDAKLYEDARAEAKRLGISLAELCRRSLQRNLKKPSGKPSRKPWMRFSGIIDEGGANESDNTSIDELVYGQK